MPNLVKHVEKIYYTILASCSFYLTIQFIVKSYADFKLNMLQREKLLQLISEHIEIRKALVLEIELRNKLILADAETKNLYKSVLESTSNTSCSSVLEDPCLLIDFLISIINSIVDLICFVLKLL